MTQENAQKHLIFGVTMNCSKVSTVIVLAAASVFVQAATAQTSGASGAAESQTGGSQASGAQTNGSQTGASGGSQTSGSSGAAGSQTGGVSGAAVPGADRKFAMMVAQTDLAE